MRELCDKWAWHAGERMERNPINDDEQSGKKRQSDGGKKNAAERLIEESRPEFHPDVRCA